MLTDRVLLTNDNCTDIIYKRPNDTFVLPNTNVLNDCCNVMYLNLSISGSLITDSDLKILKENIEYINDMIKNNEHYTILFSNKFNIDELDLKTKSPLIYKTILEWYDKLTKEEI